MAVYGRKSELIIGALGQGVVLIKFTLKGVKEGSVVRAARIGLYALRRGVVGPLEGQAFQMLRPWAETEADWNVAMKGVEWEKAGAAGAGVDRNGTAVSSFVVRDVGSWVYVDVQAAVQSWVAAPNENFGVALVGTEPAGQWYAFASSEHPTVEIRPMFEMSWIE